MSPTGTGGVNSSLPGRGAVKTISLRGRRRKADVQHRFRGWRPRRGSRRLGGVFLSPNRKVQDQAVSVAVAGLHQKNVVDRCRLVAFKDETGISRLEHSVSQLLYEARPGQRRGRQLPFHFRKIDHHPMRVGQREHAIGNRAGHIQDDLGLGLVGADARVRDRDGRGRRRRRRERERGGHDKRRHRDQVEQPAYPARQRVIRKVPHRPFKSFFPKRATCARTQVRKSQSSSAPPAQPSSGHIFPNIDSPAVSRPAVSKSNRPDP